MWNIIIVQIVRGFSFWIMNVKMMSIINIQVKHLKKTNNTTYMWHFCRGHIRKKHMQKLHKDGVLAYFDFEPFDTCEPCLMGKLRVILNGRVNYWK